MSLWKNLRRMLGQEPMQPAAPLPPTLGDDEPEPTVPELTVEQLKLVLANPNPPLILDVREPYELRQVRMSFARHIPMNDVPQHVDELRQAQAARGAQPPAVIVVCAHGSRSYSVAAWLNEQGIPAASLEGGITRWTMQGGEVTQGA